MTNSDHYNKYVDSFFTNPDGLKQYYRDYNHVATGSPVVLCMPGLTRNSKDFADIAAYMADRCRVICVEQRGRGKSEWDQKPERYRPDVYVADMVALLEHLGIKTVIAFGTSLGGMMTMLMATVKPDCVKGAILNDIGPEIDQTGVARIKSYVGKGIPPKTWEEAVRAVKFANRGVYPTFTDTNWEEFTHKLYHIENGTPIIEYDPALSKNFESSKDQTSPDLWPFFDALSMVPIVVLRGALSDILSAETLKEMEERHPDLTPVTVPDKGHVPLMTEPECKKAIDELLKKCS
ncbi:alpha/beta fold hydrolase [Kordiimonas pumila]|uniref:Alpha/beta fold hydrolase n=1 Tax=Kordiimonas pumila TaxID=2161677 RepID=A0ABV7D1M2_9PROT|nr:alpha/beta hydrolase [Kordiimonas pumila]